MILSSMRFRNMRRFTAFWRSASSLLDIVNIVKHFGGNVTIDFFRVFAIYAVVATGRQLCVLVMNVVKDSIAYLPPA